MIAQTPILVVATVICVAGISFAAGRLVPKDSWVPSAEQIAESRAEESALPSPADIAIPGQVPDVLAMPFPETYALLKAAPPETVRAYYNELVTLRPKPRRRAALAAFFKTLIHVDPVLTRELILELKGDDLWSAMFAIRAAAPPRAMHVVAEVLLSFDRARISGCSWDMLGEMLDVWGRNDPRALKQFLESHRDQDVERYFGRLARAWASYDPEAAWQWISEEIEKRPPSPERSENGDSVGEESDSRSTPTEMFSSWVEGLVEYDPDAALRYVLEHQGVEHVSAALPSVAAKLFNISPEKARDLVLRLSGDERKQALYQIGSEASRFSRYGTMNDHSSPRFVAEWLLQLGEQEDWQSAISEPLREWKFGNPAELFNWIGELPAATRAAVVRRFPAYVSSEKPSEDFDLLMQLRDPVLRQELLETLMRGAEYQREKLLGVLEQAELPATQKAYLAALIPVRQEATDESDAGIE